jgi:uncharacterized membrane protein
VLDMQPRATDAFHWRSKEVSRLEGLSDAVFGFAVTLLVVSLEVPRTFDELLATMAGFPAFAASFVLLVLIWHAQYTFFRRYGLEDTRTVVLNVALLFVVLFYIYPLKFLFSALVGVFSRLVLHAPPLGEGEGASIAAGQWPALMVIYGLGYVAIYAIFALLYRHAYQRRQALGLDEVETLLTRFSVFEFLAMIGVAVLSVALTVLLAYGAGWPGWAASAAGGWTYFLIWPAQVLIGRALNRRREALSTPRAESSAAEIAVQPRTAPR